MKKIVFISLILTFIGITAGLLLFDSTNASSYEEPKECSISNLNLEQELSKAIGIKDLTNDDFKVSDFYSMVDKEGFITYLKVNALYKAGYSQYKYNIMYYSENGKGNFKVTKTPCVGDKFEGTGINTFAQYINSIPKENISTLKSKGYYNSIYFTTSLESFLINKDKIQSLEKNKHINLENVYEVACTYHNKDKKPTFYYLTDM